MKVRHVKMLYVYVYVCRVCRVLSCGVGIIREGFLTIIMRLYIHKVPWALLVNKYLLYLLYVTHMFIYLLIYLYSRYPEMYIEASI